MKRKCFCLRHFCFFWCLNSWFRTKPHGNTPGHGTKHAETSRTKTLILVPTLIDLYRLSAKYPGTLLAHLTVALKKQKQGIDQVLGFMYMFFHENLTVLTILWFYNKSYQQLEVSSLNSQWSPLRCCPLCLTQRVSYKHQTLWRTKVGTFCQQYDLFWDYFI